MITFTAMTKLVAEEHGEMEFRVPGGLYRFRVPKECATLKDDDSWRFDLPPNFMAVLSFKGRTKELALEDFMRELGVPVDENIIFDLIDD